MTGALPVAGAPEYPAPVTYGTIVANTREPSVISRLVGGSGTAEVKHVLNGMHVPAAVAIVEHVRLVPGASCGLHLHAEREEIYYILSGAAVMTVNGDKITVGPGDLITCPLGTVHGIGVPPEAAEPMSFFVVEALPGAGPPKMPPLRVSMPAELDGCAGYRGGGHAQETRVATVRLADYLTGPLRGFTLIEIPPGDVLGPARLPAGIAEILFVTAGQAKITAAGTTAEGGYGLTVAAPLGAEMTIANTSGESSLTVISTQAAG